MLLNKIMREFMFFLFILYYSQGFIYAKGSVISKSSIVLLILISGVYFMKTFLLNDRKSLFYRTWTFLVLINIIGFVFTADISNHLHKDMFKTLLGCMLPFYPFYYFSKKGDLEFTHLLRFSLILLPVYIIQYSLNQSTVMLEYNLDEGRLVINSSYLFVGLIPFVFLIRRKIVLSMGMMMVIIFYVIMGAKRGAIISGLTGVLIYYYYLIKTIEERNRVINYLFVFVVVLGLSAYVYVNLINNPFTMNRLDSIIQGDSSSREVIYGLIINNWFNSSFGSLICGHGFAASVNIAGNYAHNDWLELLSNFGLIGIMAYFILFYSAIIYCFNNELAFDYRIIMITILIIWFMVSVFSMWYTTMGWTPQTMMLGYLIGSNNNNQVKIIADARSERIKVFKA